jgi:hypothetical protein
MRIDTLRWNCEFLRCICIIGILSIANIVSKFLHQLKEEQCTATSGAIFISLRIYTFFTPPSRHSKLHLSLAINTGNKTLHLTSAYSMLTRHTRMYNSTRNILFSYYATTCMLTVRYEVFWQTATTYVTIECTKAFWKSLYLNYYIYEGKTQIGST